MEMLIKTLAEAILKLALNMTVEWIFWSTSHILQLEKRLENDKVLYEPHFVDCTVHDLIKICKSQWTQLERRLCEWSYCSWNCCLNNEESIWRRVNKWPSYHPVSFFWRDNQLMLIRLHCSYTPHITWTFSFLQIEWSASNVYVRFTPMCTLNQTMCHIRSDDHIIETNNNNNITRTSFNSH